MAVPAEARNTRKQRKPPSGAGITKHVAPRALFYFRYAALVTVLAGFMLMGPRTGDILSFRPPYIGLGIGAWLGLIMFVITFIVLAAAKLMLMGLSRKEGSK